VWSSGTLIVLRQCWLVVLVAACSGETGPTLAADALADEIVAAQCEHAVTCLEMPDQATCVASRPADNILLTTVADILAGTIHYDAHAGAACVAFLRDRPCAFSTGTFYSAVTRLYLPHRNPCIRMFEGTVGDGETCNAQAECAAYGDCFGPSCDWYTSCCTGACSARPVVGIGDRCDTAHCPDDAYCSGADDFTCKTQITTAGAMCNASDACAPPLACVFQAHDLPGTCVQEPTPSPTGGSCPCFDTDMCEAGTCVPKPGVGEPCGPMGECVGYAACIGIGTTCVAPIPPNEACSVAVGSPGCLGEATCVDSVCTLPPTVACP
jgi:hypothetical protein